MNPKVLNNCGKIQNSKFKMRTYIDDNTNNFHGSVFKSKSLKDFCPSLYKEF